MTSKWRNNKGKESFANKNSNVNANAKENFASIPLFDVLDNNHRKNDAVKEPFTSSSKTVEGFNMFSNDYFINCKRTIKFLQASSFGGAIKNGFKTILNPINELDKAFEGLLFTAFSVFLQFERAPCKSDTVKKRINTDASGNSFTWSSPTKDGFTTLHTKEGFENNRNANVRKTVKSFQANHPWISGQIIIDKVGDYYISKVNEYETRMRRYATPEELIVFNNDFDDSLNDVKIRELILKKAKDKINAIKPTDDASSLFIADTQDNWKNFIKNNARFMINNTNMIEYFSLNDNCFPFPKDMDAFNTISSKPLDDAYIVDLKDYDDAIKLMNTRFANNKDQNTILSIITTIYASNPRKDTMQTYLKNTIEKFTFLAIDNFKKTYPAASLSNKTILLYQARIGTLYVKIVNYIEYHLYRLFKMQLSGCELTVINAVFYEMLMERKDILEGNAAHGISINKLVGHILNEIATTMKIPNVSEKITPCNIIKDAVSKKYVMEIVRDTYRLTDISNTSVDSQFSNFFNFEKWKDTIKLFDASDNPIIIPSTNPYIDSKYNIPIDTYLSAGTEAIQTDIDAFYLPKLLSQCEKDTRAIKDEFKQYASVIKFEIYRIMLLPICIYVAYNFYYIFFFKDCAKPTKTVDDNGNVTYKNECEECFNPLFPDWEGYFHYFEKHNMDYLLEFLFKPVKLLYTVLNGIKALFRQKISLVNNHIPKEEIPYVFFIGILVSLFVFLWYNLSGIIEFLRKIVTLDPPGYGANTNGTSGASGNTSSSGFEDTAFFVTAIAFYISALDKISGFDLLSFIRSKFDGPQEVKEKPKTWSKWMGESSGPVVGLLKTIYTFIYWGLKYYITIALVPLAVLICFIYIVWNLFFGLYNYSSDEISISDKIELMQRVMYTKLYINSANRDWTFINVFKTVFWVILFFMIEITAFIIIVVGLTNIMNNIKSNELKTFLIILYAIIIGLLGLWSIRKFRKQGQQMNASYIDPRDPNVDYGQPDKRIEIVKNSDIFGNLANICTDDYERQTENKFSTIFLNSDKVNYEIIKKFMEKNTDPNKPSSLSKWSKSISSNLGKMSNYIGEKANAVGKYATEKTDKLKQMVNPQVNVQPGLAPPTETLSGTLRNAGNTMANTIKNFGFNPNKSK